MGTGSKARPCFSEYWLFEAINWDLVVLDECHNAIESSGTEHDLSMLNMKGRFLHLTGTALKILDQYGVSDSYVYTYEKEQRLREAGESFCQDAPIMRLQAVTPWWVQNKNGDWRWKKIDCRDWKYDDTSRSLLMDIVFGAGRNDRFENTLDYDKSIEDYLAGKSKTIYGTLLPRTMSEPKKTSAGTSTGDGRVIMVVLRTRAECHEFKARMEEHPLAKTRMILNTLMKTIHARSASSPVDVFSWASRSSHCRRSTG